MKIDKVLLLSCDFHSNQFNVRTMPANCRKQMNMSNRADSILEILNTITVANNIHGDNILYQYL